MKKNVIVSLADSNYFDLLNELIDSIKQFKESSSTAICILDAGLKEDQLRILSSKLLDNRNKPYPHPNQSCCCWNTYKRANWENSIKN